MKKAMVLVLLLICAVTASAVQLDRGEIRLRARAYWGEYDNANSFWPDSVLNPIINDAQAMIAHFGRAVENDIDLVMSKGTRAYSLPSDFDDVIGVLHLNRVESPVVLNFMPWESFSKGITEGTLPPDQYAIHNRKIYVQPVDEETDENSIRVMYFATVDTMPDDTSTCRLPEYWHPLVPLVTTDLIRSVPIEQIVQRIMLWEKSYLSRREEKAIEQ